MCPMMSIQAIYRLALFCIRATPWALQQLKTNHCKKCSHCCVRAVPALFIFSLCTGVLTLVKWPLDVRFEPLTFTPEAPIEVWHCDVLCQSTICIFAHWHNSGQFCRMRLCAACCESRQDYQWCLQGADNSLADRDCNHPWLLHNPTTKHNDSIVFCVKASHTLYCSLHEAWWRSSITLGWRLQIALWPSSLH